MIEEMMISVSDRYFQALGELDREDYLSCFSTDAGLFDPYGGKPFKGHEGLAKWFASMERTWSEFSTKPVAQYISGDRLAIQWQATGMARSGKIANFSDINVFTVDKSGLINHPT